GTARRELGARGNARPFTASTRRLVRNCAGKGGCTRMANLGFVGLGVMGGRMVNRLLDKGHTVTGYNRTKSKAQWLLDRGMRWADSPRAVCAEADFVFSMLTNSAAVEDVAEGSNGLLAGLGSGKIWIEMSTMSPAVSIALAGRARERGADMVDAPVSGSVVTL